MGEDKREQLEFIPASIKTIEHVSPKYSCRHFEQRDAEVAITRSLRCARPNSEELSDHLAAQPDRPRNNVLYDYQASRSGSCATAYPDGYQGYLPADGYAGYEQTDVILAGCCAHVRWKFIEP